MGVADPSRLTPHQLRRNIDGHTNQSYAEIYEWLAPGQLLSEAPETWAADWRAATPDSFHPASPVIGGRS